jgi:trehalose-6-phosphate synthase
MLSHLKEKINDELIMGRIESRYGDYNHIPQEYRDKEIERESNLATVKYSQKTFIVAVITLIVTVLTLVVTIIK